MLLGQARAREWPSQAIFVTMREVGPRGSLQGRYGCESRGSDLVGIGRREFIRAFGASLVAVAAVPAGAVSLIDNFYLNRKLGLGFRKPNGWSFANVREMGSVKKGQLLAIDDVAAARELLDSMDLPFVSVLRPAKMSVRFAPSAQFYIVDDMPAWEELFELGDKLESLLREFNDEEAPADKLSRGLEKLHDDAAACDRFLKSFEILSQPREFQLSSCDAAEYTATYFFEHERLAHPVRVRARTIYVNHRIASYLIRLVDSPYGTAGDEFDFDPFIDSIRLV